MTELERIEQLEKEIRALKGLNNQNIPTYSFSKIRDKELKEFLDKEQDDIRIYTVKKSGLKAGIAVDLTQPFILI